MILTFFLISRKFLIKWYIICIGLEQKNFFLTKGARQNGKSAIMENRKRPKLWTKLFFHHNMITEKYQKRNSVFKALHSDPRVIIFLPFHHLFPNHCYSISKYVINNTIHCAKVFRFHPHHLDQTHCHSNPK